jgi:hypothetical protein
MLNTAGLAAAQGLGDRSRGLDLQDTGLGQHRAAEGVADNVNAAVVTTAVRNGSLLRRSGPIRVRHAGATFI